MSEPQVSDRKMARFSMYSGELINSSLSHLEDFDSRMGVVRISHKAENNASKEVKIASFAGLKRPIVGKYIRSILLQGEGIAQLLKSKNQQFQLGILHSEMNFVDFFKRSGT